VPEQDDFAGAIDRKSCQWCIVFVDRIDLVRLRQQHRTAEFGYVALSLDRLMV
jgi:hypothetical protein